MIFEPSLEEIEEVVLCLSKGESFGTGIIECVGLRWGCSSGSLGPARRPTGWKLCEGERVEGHAGHRKGCGIYTARDGGSGGLTYSLISPQLPEASPGSLVKGSSGLS